MTVLTFNNGVLFRTRNFKPDYRYTANFIDLWSVDEMVLLDITRPGDGDRENFYQVVNEFSKNCFVPITVGGGISSVEEINNFLRMGADKVVINTHAHKNPAFIRESSRLFGSQCIVVSIDAKLQLNNGYEALISFGTEATGSPPEEWARQAEAHGAGEILITSIDKDGTLEGYDNELNRLVADAVDVPVLVCGGAGSWQHFVDGFTIGKASAVCTTNIYHFTETSIKSAKSYLTQSEITVRI
ncbi:imidazole glycerol phosphate synthase subunit HisF [Fibrobacterota bacterium]